MMVAASAGFATVHASASTAAPDENEVLYNSIPSPLPGNLPSLGYQATQTTEFGNEITTVRPNSPEKLKSFSVTMSSWACETGSATDGTCAINNKGDTFREPITLNLYNASTGGVPGSLIATQTNTYSIPYRPKASPSCGNGGWSPPSCFHGKTHNIIFQFGAPNVVLPQTFVYGIAYNTSGYGPTPYGYGNACNTAGAGNSDACPYDSLNVALSQGETPQPTTGTDTYPGTVVWNTSTMNNYCDGGTNGFGTFRQDEASPPSNSCWSVNNDGNSPYYIPAVKVVET
jgi:hypothetical protein